VHGDAEQQAAGQEGEKQPPGDGGVSDGVLLFGGRFGSAGLAGWRRSVGGGCSRRDERADRRQHGKECEACGPKDSLLAKREERLEEKWVSQQAQQAAGIAGRIEKVRIALSARSGASQPDLEQRSAAGEHEAGQTDASHEYREQPDARRNAALPKKCAAGERRQEGASCKKKA
jgi:hypothetical protein